MIAKENYSEFDIPAVGCPLFVYKIFLLHYCFLYMQVSAELASQFGELVADPDTNELLHYTEKPETFVSTNSDTLIIFREFQCFHYFLNGWLKMYLVQPF